jgi:hypothetical protein
MDIQVISAKSKGTYKHRTSTGSQQIIHPDGSNHATLARNLSPPVWVLL